MTNFISQLNQPPREYSAIPFWFLNGDLNEAELCRRLQDFCTMAFMGWCCIRASVCLNGLAVYHSCFFTVSRWRPRRRHGCSLLDESIAQFERMLRRMQSGRKPLAAFLCGHQIVYRLACGSQDESVDSTRVLLQHRRRAQVRAPARCGAK